MKYIKKADIIYISSLIFSTLAIICLIFATTYEKKDLVVIEVDGEIYGKYSIFKNQQIEIGDNSENILEIKDGQAYMIEANCPDKLCIKQYAINSNLGTIVCLPNRVIVSLDTQDYSDVDVVSWLWLKVNK